MVDRRKFLTGAAVGGMATLVASAGAVGAQPLIAAAAPRRRPRKGPRLKFWPRVEPGSDFMVDVIKSLGFEYLASNPGSSFRGLHESIINYGGNKAPEFLTCCHEESSVALAHGYAEVEGKPMLVFAHSTVGLQHAAMGIYNAWGGRVPVYIILGNTLDATKRGGARAVVSQRPGCGRDGSRLYEVGRYTHLAATLRRIRRPRLQDLDDLADVSHRVGGRTASCRKTRFPRTQYLRIPKLTLAAPPQGDSGSVAEAARLLVAAENPVIVAGRVGRTEAGAANLKELGEFLQVAGR